mmetsp:Transcript_15899/g.44980  ORF Transcript_15899/g.44980 Transcript_15899/m.44980 type:complete len:247 (+) Transcript_15899:464-1204(+)
MRAAAAIPARSSWRRTPSKAGTPATSSARPTSARPCATNRRTRSWLASTATTASTGARWPVPFSSTRLPATSTWPSATAPRSTAVCSTSSLPRSSRSSTRATPSTRSGSATACCRTEKARARSTAAARWWTPTKPRPGRTSTIWRSFRPSTGVVATISSRWPSPSRPWGTATTTQTTSTRRTRAMVTPSPRSSRRCLVCSSSTTCPHLWCAALTCSPPRLSLSFTSWPSPAAPLPSRASLIPSSSQ